MSPAEAESVSKVNGAFYAAVENGDLDLLAQIWADGRFAETVTCVHPGWPPLHGRDEVLRSWAVIMANTTYVQYFLTDVAVELAGEVAIVTCAENILTSVGDEGDDSSSSLAGGRAVATNIFRRTPTGWRLWLHHASPVLPPHEGDEEGDDEGSMS